MVAKDKFTSSVPFEQIGTRNIGLEWNTPCMAIFVLKGDIVLELPLVLRYKCGGYILSKSQFMIMSKTTMKSSYDTSHEIPIKFPIYFTFTKLCGHSLYSKHLYLSGIW